MLARISLGLMNFIKSCQNSLPTDTNDHDLSYYKGALEVKALLHNTIHCLIMAEFWDSQQLPDIAHDLFMTAKTNLEASLIRKKEPLMDYLTMSIMRSGKEKQQIFGETAKASESKTVVQPFFIASLVDFREIIAPYASTYESVFKSIYPLNVIEAQSAFETKAQGLVDTILATLDEPENALQSYVINSSRSMNDLIIDLRDKISGADNMKELRDRIQEKTADIDDLLKIVVAKHPNLQGDYELTKLVEELNYLRKPFESEKISLICNDVSFVEALKVALGPSFTAYSNDLQNSSAALENGIKSVQENTQALKNEVG